MHLVFVTRGIKQDVDRMIMNLESLYYSWKRKQPDNTIKPAVLQNMLQPIQFWSMVFPREEYENVCRTLQPIETLGFTGAPMALPDRKLSLAVLRQMLGLKKLPEWKREGMRYPVYNHNTQVLGIGVKEDYNDSLGNEAL